MQLVMSTFKNECTLSCLLFLSFWNLSPTSTPCFAVCQQARCVCFVTRTPEFLNKLSPEPNSASQQSSARVGCSFNINATATSSIEAVKRRIYRYPVPKNVKIT